MTVSGGGSLFEKDGNTHKQQRLATAYSIRMEPGILDYPKHGVLNVQDVFEKAANYIYNLRTTIEDDVGNKLVDRMAMAVFGSNYIERVGCDLPETIGLCRKIFLGEGLSDVTPRSSEYCRRLEAHIRSDTESEKKIQERREVINHAMALKYMTERVVQDGEPLSENLIMKTHAILCSDIPVVSGGSQVVPGNAYAGKYRTCHVAAGNTNFVTPNRIGQAMTRFIDELNNHFNEAGKKQEIDPFFTAAHACGEFVMIHPFLDGNGRTCRMILNTILLKYAGIVCPIGEDDDKRREYLDIAMRRSGEETGNGELAWHILSKFVTEMEWTKQGNF